MKNKRPKTQAVDEELLPCMDYLHGDVVGDQFKAACQYQYARESKTLGKASQFLRNNPTADAEEVLFQIERQFPAPQVFRVAPIAASTWLMGDEWRFIWQSPSFPAKGWNQLSKADRAELLYGLPPSTNEPQRLRLGEVMFLTHFLDQLKGMAEKARAEWKAARTAGTARQKVYPILELKGTPFVQALLPLDFSKKRTRLLKEIGLWLQQSENKARFDKHEVKTEAGTAKQAKDRLKDVATWRLYRELGCDRALSFAEENRKRDESGVPRPFHDPRKGRTKKVPPNEAPLYSEESGFLKAKERAEDHLAELIPWEFGKYAEEKERQKREWAAAFTKALKEAKKISGVLPRRQD